jgi:MSHA biogenesis protein MshJ
MRQVIQRYWTPLAARVDEMALRQRAMLFVTLSVALIGLVHVFLLEPLFVKQKNLIERAKRDQSQLTAIRAQISAVVREQQSDPEMAALRQLESRIAEAERTLAGKKEDFAAASRLPALVRELLGGARRVNLEQLRVLPGAQVEGSQLYRHGVEMSLTGTYLDLLQYLAALEKLPVRLLWGSTELQVQQYPEVRLTVQLYTLQPQRHLGL